jgi:plasmid stabilization system protein ParE
MNFRLLAPAISEAAEAAEFYESRVTGLGSDFLVELETTITRILQFPEAWSQISKDYRHCNLRRFPFTIVYTIEKSDEIIVISIFHQSRRPLSWKDNLER